MCFLKSVMFLFIAMKSVEEVAPFKTIYEISQWFSQGFKAHLSPSVMLEFNENTHYTLHPGGLKVMQEFDSSAIVFFVFVFIIPLLSLGISIVLLVRFKVTSKCLNIALSVVLFILFIPLMYGFVSTAISNAELQKGFRNYSENMDESIDDTEVFYTTLEKEFINQIENTYSDYYNKQQKLFQSYAKTMKTPLEKFNNLHQYYPEVISILNKLEDYTNKTCTLEKQAKLFQSDSQSWNNRLSKNFKELNGYNTTTIEEIKKINMSIATNNMQNLNYVCENFTELPVKKLRANLGQKVKSFQDAFAEKNITTINNLIKFNMSLYFTKKNSTEFFKASKKAIRDTKLSFAEITKDQLQSDGEVLGDKSADYQALTVSILTLFLVGVLLIFFRMMYNFPLEKQLIGKIIFYLGLFCIVVLKLLLTLLVQDSFSFWYGTQNSICNKNKSDLVTFVDTSYGLNNSLTKFYHHCDYNKTFYSDYSEDEKIKKFIFDNELNVDILKPDTFVYSDFELLPEDSILDVKIILDNVAQLLVRSNSNMNAIKVEVEPILALRDKYNYLSKLTKESLEENLEDNTDLVGFQAKMKNAFNNFHVKLYNSYKGIQSVMMELNEFKNVNFWGVLDGSSSNIERLQDNMVRNVMEDIRKTSETYKESSIALTTTYLGKIGENFENTIGRCESLISVFNRALINCKIILQPLNALWVGAFLVLLTLFPISLLIAMWNFAPKMEPEAEPEEANNYYEVTPLQRQEIPLVLGKDTTDSPTKKSARLESKDIELKPLNVQEVSSSPELDESGSQVLSWVYNDYEHTELPPPYKEFESPQPKRLSVNLTRSDMSTYKRSVSRDDQHY
ncbi:unnamed protein product [Brassicogethes aeneus]|uniref:Uncharacterized protein n=1 Tax=Brassicogethes aeneus TaxID=1431903 RepID=A0A9P0FDW6_BRAAE|nr:unnamed protein product [Brassicogethes aeneus]